MQKACSLLLIILLCFGVVACARLEGPDVNPEETAAPVTESPAPSETPLRKNEGSAVSTRSPLSDSTPAAEEGTVSTSARGDIVSASTAGYAGPLEASGSLEQTGQERTGVQPVRMKAAWVATVFNIDFPSAIGDAQAQQEELIRIFDNVRSWGLDTVIFQIRPMGDALYNSSINPWSHFLTGSQGQDPGWDPLAFAIEQAHQRGLALHGWLNPYRVIHSSTGFSVSDLAEDSFAQAHPEWIIEAGGSSFYDPAVPQVREHIAETVSEIIRNYDIDGIHFDDYFYPAEYPLPDGADPDGILGRERRENVNAMIRLVYDTIKSYNPRIIFGISPPGIWKNAASDPLGSDTRGSESYYVQAADTLTWVREKIVDYVAPQLYWPIGHELADYRTLTAWWSEKLAGSGVSLIIGQGIYEDEVAAEITRELEVNAQHPEITGSIYFSYKDLAGSPACTQAIADWYRQ